MRKKLLSQLRDRLNISLPLVFKESKDISDDPSFLEGHVGFQLENVGQFFFFLSIVANDDSDSFRVSFAWNTSSRYPLEPYRDLRASAQEFLGRKAGEFQLALLSSETIPWVWHLDPNFGKWKARLDQTTAAMTSGGRVPQDEYARLLSQMPKKCPLNEALAMIPLVVDQLATALREHAKPYMNAIAAVETKSSQ